MSYITTTSPEHASDEQAALYQRVQGNLDYLPNYARVFGHRPQLMEKMGSLMAAIRQPLPPRLWCLVTLAAARASGSSYCSLVFARHLIPKYFSEGELESILSEPGSLLLNQRENAAMDFATRVAKDASAIRSEDIERLRSAGFSDTDIFDLAAAAAWRCFFARIPDSLGVQPDRSLGELKQPLLDLLVVGRHVEDSCAGEANKLPESSHRAEASRSAPGKN